MSQLGYYENKFRMWDTRVKYRILESGKWEPHSATAFSLSDTVSPATTTLSRNIREIGGGLAANVLLVPWCEEDFADFKIKSVKKPSK